MRPARNQQPAQRSPQQRDALAERQRLARQAIGDVFAVQPLHRQVGHTVSGGAVRDVGNDGRVGKIGQQRALAHEPF
jgi:hypothetical protein